MKSALRPAVILLLLMLTALSSAQAQTQSTTGVIKGTIADENGAVVLGAAIVVANPATNFTKTAATDENGRFVFLQLQPGRYTLTASKATPPSRRRIWTSPSATRFSPRAVRRHARRAAQKRPRLFLRRVRADHRQPDAPQSEPSHRHALLRAEPHDSSQ